MSETSVKIIKNEMKALKCITLGGISQRRKFGRQVGLGAKQLAILRGIPGSAASA